MGKLKGLGKGNSHTEYKYKGLLNGLSMLLNTLEFLYDTLYFASFLCLVWEQIGKLLSLWHEQRSFAECYVNSQVCMFGTVSPPRSVVGFVQLTI